MCPKNLNQFRLFKDLYSYSQCLYVSVVPHCVISKIRSTEFASRFLNKKQIYKFRIFDSCYSIFFTVSFSKNLYVSVFPSSFKTDCEVSQPRSTDLLPYFFVEIFFWYKSILKQPRLSDFPPYFFFLKIIFLV